MIDLRIRNLSLFRCLKSNAVILCALRGRLVEVVVAELKKIIRELAEATDLLVVLTR